MTAIDHTPENPGENDFSDDPMLAPQTDARLMVEVRPDQRKAFIKKVAALGKAAASKSLLAPANDPTHPHNAPEHHTGKACVENECDKPAGTWWSPYWCQGCNAKRLDRVSAGLRAAMKGR